MRLRTASIWAAILIGGVLFIFPAVVEGIFIPSLMDGPNPMPEGEAILLGVALRIHRYRWLLAPLTVLVLFLAAAFSRESSRRTENRTLTGARRVR